MPLCKLCEKKFPIKKVIDGKTRNLQNRKYCLECSPFGSGNTRKLELPPAKEKNKKYYRWQKKARKERKLKLAELLGGKCVICDYHRCAKALEFHHVDESTKEDKGCGLCFLSRWDKLLEEIKKCVLLCSNCHREVHEDLHLELSKQWKDRCGSSAR